MHYVIYYIATKFISRLRTEKLALFALRSADLLGSRGENDVLYFTVNTFVSKK
ncbi:hypothetical protein SAMN06269250_0285 [Spirosoma fluviale]|uniref:Uncharacterized protein n=1 Tax=Spirosoma fluviale TaxID=1597977 RepID=A0A286F4C2_9BACT|nr:hypothetical protein SAMN06269250_0285 [Spirosoma fluviale]